MSNSHIEEYLRARSNTLAEAFVEYVANDVTNVGVEGEREELLRRVDEVAEFVRALQNKTKANTSAAAVDPFDNVKGNIEWACAFFIGHGIITFDIVTCLKLAVARKLSVKRKVLLKSLKLPKLQRTEHSKICVDFDAAVEHLRNNSGDSQLSSDEDEDDNFAVSTSSATKRRKMTTAGSTESTKDLDVIERSQPVVSTFSQGDSIDKFLSSVPDDAKGKVSDIIDEYYGAPYELIVFTLNKSDVDHYVNWKPVTKKQDKLCLLYYKNYRQPIMAKFGRRGRFVVLVNENERPLLFQNDQEGLKYAVDFPDSYAAWVGLEYGPVLLQSHLKPREAQLTPYRLPSDPPQPMLSHIPGEYAYRSARWIRAYVRKPAMHGQDRRQGREVWFILDTGSTRPYLEPTTMGALGWDDVIGGDTEKFEVAQILVTFLRAKQTSNESAHNINLLGTDLVMSDDVLDQCE
jgi:hypothetical protein